MTYLITLTPTHLYKTSDRCECARILCGCFLLCFFFNIVTLITDVSTLDGGLCTCAAAAMLAMVLRWFIWLIAIVTDAGGRLTGINGWGIIIKGSSNPGGGNKKKGNRFMHLFKTLGFFSPDGQYSSDEWQDGSHCRTKQVYVSSFPGYAWVSH